MKDILVPDIATFRTFHGATMAQRRRRVAQFFNPGIELRRRLGQGLHDRGEASIFALHDLDPDDLAAVDVHLPMRTRTLSAARKRVAAGETWDVSVRGDAWGVDDMEELYVTLNIGVLELEPRARLVVRGNVFVLVCQRLIVHEPRADWQIGILPTPHSVDFGHGPMRGAAGGAGLRGIDGGDGRAIRVEETFIGPRPCEPVVPQLLDGRDGAAGGAGGRGGSGRNGGMCKLADIAVRDLSGALTVFAQAGRGGDGGDGGPGGDGGDGGDGVRGPRLVSGQVRDGRPGAGGDGGPGGEGGAAGSGGIASNIYVTVPADAAHRVTGRSLASEPGSPGRGGRGGTAGRAGAAPGAAPTAAGTPGLEGARGARGRSRAAPWIFVNEIPVAGTAVRPPDDHEFRDHEESMHEHL